MISRSYPQTGEWVMIGDKVMLDEIYPGKVMRVLQPSSADAQHHECSETGGLMIDTEHFGLMLLPFGSCQEIRRVEE